MWPLHYADRYDRTAVLGQRPALRAAAATPAEVGAILDVVAHEEPTVYALLRKLGITSCCGRPPSAWDPVIAAALIKRSPTGPQAVYVGLTIAVRRV